MSGSILTLRDPTPPPAPPGQHRYVVRLRDPADDIDAWDNVKPLPRSSRRRQADAGLERSARFIEDLRKMVRQHGRSSEVSFVGDPMSLPFVEVVCTPPVASTIQGMAQVHSIIDEAEASRGFDVIWPQR